MTETIHLQLLLATFAGWVGRRQTAMITYLIEENRVLKEQLESGGNGLPGGWTKWSGRLETACTMIYSILRKRNPGNGDRFFNRDRVVCIFGYYAVTTRISDGLLGGE